MATNPASSRRYPIDSREGARCGEKGKIEEPKERQDREWERIRPSGGWKRCAEPAKTPAEKGAVGFYPQKRRKTEDAADAARTIAIELINRGNDSVRTDQPAD